MRSEMDFEFGLIGNDLALSEDEHPMRMPHLSEKAIQKGLERQNYLNYNKWEDDMAQRFKSFLNDLISELQPREDDYLARVDILNRLQSALDYLNGYKGAKLSTYGSFESNFYTRWADLDLSLELPNKSAILLPINKKLKVKVLQSFLHDVIVRADARNVQFVPFARVPLVTFEDSRHNISCDISVDNGIAMLKSRLLRWIGEIDSRCRDLIFLVKCWAKAHSINDPKTGTLNSFALCLLVIFHLQTQSPPILPPLKMVLDEDIALQLSDPQITTENVLSACWKKIQPFINENFGSQNKSSVADLFVSFFNQFSAVKELWAQGLAVCTYSAKWGDKTSTSSKWRKKQYAMAVEDPFDRTENCARSVQSSTCETIFKAFATTADTLCHPTAGFELSNVLDVLFKWPVSTQNLGLSSWLAKIHVKGNTVFVRHRQKQKRVRIRNTKSSQIQEVSETYKGNVDGVIHVPLGTLIEKNLESEFFTKLGTGDRPRRRRGRRNALLVTEGEQGTLHVDKSGLPGRSSQLDADFNRSALEKHKFNVKQRRRRYEGMPAAEGQSNGFGQGTALLSAGNNQTGDLQVHVPTVTASHMRQNRWNNRGHGKNGLHIHANERRTQHPSYGGEVGKVQAPRDYVNQVHRKENMSMPQKFSLNGTTARENSSTTKYPISRNPANHNSGTESSHSRRNRPFDRNLNESQVGELVPQGKQYASDGKAEIGSNKVYEKPTADQSVRKAATFLRKDHKATLSDYLPPVGKHWAPKKGEQSK